MFHISTEQNTYSELEVSRGEYGASVTKCVIVSSQNEGYKSPVSAIFFNISIRAAKQRRSVACSFYGNATQQHFDDSPDAPADSASLPPTPTLNRTSGQRTDRAILPCRAILLLLPAQLFCAPDKK